MKKNNILNGLHKEFYENGQLKEKGNFIAGKEDGLHEEFYENGKIWIRRNFVDGKINGLYEWFFRMDK